jgi:branched-chain amino acid transport system permease protein
LDFRAWVGVRGLAAVILSLKYGTLTPALGIDLTIKALTVAVIGGAGRLEGAVIAAFGLGIAESMTTAYIGANWSVLVGYALLLMCIILLPEGIFRRSVRRVG